MMVEVLFGRKFIYTEGFVPLRYDQLLANFKTDTPPSVILLLSAFAAVVQRFSTSWINI